MATRPARIDITIAILAKRPVADFAKTRLIPVLGADGAAALQARMIKHAVAVARAVAPVTLWVTPDHTHPLFREVAPHVTIKRQPDGDLGARMAAAISTARGPVLVIGTDCPSLTSDRLHEAGDALAASEVVIIPAEDGGYGLIGMKTLHAELFSGMAWSVPTVMSETRRRLTALSISARVLAPTWDIDSPEDLERLRASEFAYLLSGKPQK
ncbi:MAG: TIGR04282 family arsenosugar biosynthesis glycosyltransferase [Xanthobacteraceae bacterium]